MKKIMFLLPVLISLLLAGSLSAQVTLTSIYGVYSSLDEVQYVLEKGLIDGRIVEFLQNENQPADQKAAVMNALTAKNRTKSNALTFKQFVARKYRENWQQLNTTKLSADELFCLGYLTILDEGGAIQNGLPLLKQAVSKDPSNYTFHMITAVAEAQESIQNGDLCQAWQKVEAVINNSAITSDMSTSMENALIDSVETYKKACN